MALLNKGKKLQESGVYVTTIDRKAFCLEAYIEKTHIFTLKIGQKCEFFYYYAGYYSKNYFSDCSNAFTTI